MSRDDSRDWTGPVRFGGARRAAILKALAPYLADPAAEAAALRELEELARVYVSDLGAGVNDREKPDHPRRIVAEVDALIEGANRLRVSLAGLSDATRAELGDWVGYARGPADPPAWDSFIAPDTLERMAAACDFLVSRAAMHRKDVEQRRPAKRGRPPNHAALMITQDLARVWKRYTEQPLPRGTVDFRTLWGRFVVAWFAAVDPDVEKATAYYMAGRAAERIHAREAVERARLSEKNPRK